MHWRAGALVSALTYAIFAMGCSNPPPTCGDKEVLAKVASLALTSKAYLSREDFFMGSARARKELSVPPTFFHNLNPMGRTFALAAAAQELGDDAILATPETFQRLAFLELSVARSTEMDERINKRTCSAEAILRARELTSRDVDKKGRPLPKFVWWDKQIPTEDVIAFHLPQLNRKSTVDYSLQRLDDGNVYIEVLHAR